MVKNNIYVGQRYVPKIMGEWLKTNTYEGLSIVTHQGTSYTSKKRVPEGVDISNEDYWVITGNYNAQIEVYREDVKQQKENLEEFKGKTNALFAEIVINVKDFGAVGDGVTDDTSAIQSAFNVAETVNADNVIFPSGVYAINSTGIEYKNPHSNIFFKGSLKHVDTVNELHGSLFRVSCDDVTIHQLKIDGNRANTIYDTGTNPIGHQFNIASYGFKNIVFLGGWSKDALQNHVQMSSTVRFIDFIFDTSGEHGVYLTTKEGTVGGEYAYFDNCTFKDWGLVTDGTGLSGRDYKHILCENSRFITSLDKTGSNYVTSSQHRDTISTPESKKHVYNNCSFKGLKHSSAIFVSSNIRFKLLNSTVEGGVRGVTGRTKLVEVYNTSIELFNAFTTMDQPANKYDNCTFKGGRMYPSEDIEILNSHIYFNENTFVTFIDFFNKRAVSTIVKAIVANNTFYDFPKADSSVAGIIVCNSEKTELIQGNRFINCIEAYGISRIGDKTIVTGNIDLTNSGVDMRGILSNPKVMNNVLIDSRA